ncbi:LysM peptidoglycan-binding domain-containing protein [Kitasatospora viridis]|uniref:LysM domain-containing protein n=1 Tax=Kitasatospora viridis TaxID=281105 RepID=A0A561UAR8_9ACTN|nr:LysM peptidoglycan-binding domain-containing protein [Kitasatospora viridis]TWF96457.1 LysM domain-containing protein [Kitasatospora viridis]
MATTRPKAETRHGGSSGSRRSAPTGPARPPGRRRGPLRALPAALGALLVLALLLVGVPAALLYGTQAVASMGGVGHRSIGEVLTSPDDGRLFLWALVVIGWGAWACFACSVLLEVPAQLRGRVVRRIPAFGWSQRLAGGLVGAVIALLPVAGGAFAATAGPAHSVSAVMPQLAAAPQYAALAGAPATPALQAADPGAVQGPSYTVKDSRPADSLWSIAEHQLGSGDRWQEIAKLNAGRVMDGSGTTFDADRPIQPGWQLLMPADAKPDGAPANGPQSAPAPAPAAGGGQVTVREGDTLSAIAQRELGSSQDWPQLFDANKGVQAPDGERLTDPDMLAPGMVLTVPGAAAPAAPAAPTQTQTGQQPAQPQPAQPQPSQPQPAQSAPAQQAPAQGTPAPSAHPSAPAAHPTAHPSPGADAAPHPSGKPASAGHGTGRSQPAPHTEDPKSDYTGALAVSGIGVLLAAALIGAVAHRRGHQQRLRRPRHRIPMPSPEAAEFEAELKSRQGSTGLDLLNRSLRTLARNVSRTGKRLPPLAAVRVTGGGTVELHLAAPAVPIAPFRAAHAANVWWCAGDATDLLTAQQAARVPAPYPALVTLGTAPDGAAVLADLETVRLMHLSGHPEDARAVLRTVALELAHSPLADRLNLHLIGFPEELPVSETVADRVHRYPTLEAALSALGPRTDRARTALLAAGAAHPRDARSRGQADEAWVPDIVLSAQAPIGDVPAELGRLLDGRPRTCLAVLSRAPERGTGPVARWTLPSTGAAVLPGLHLAVQLQRLTEDQFAHWSELLATAASETQEPAPAWTYDGEEIEPADLPVPVPVLAGVASGTAPFVGGSLPDGPPESGPKLIARLIGTGTSPFASVNPAGAGMADAPSMAVALPPLPELPALTARHIANGQGRHATVEPAAEEPLTEEPATPVAPTAFGDLFPPPDAAPEAEPEADSELDSEPEPDAEPEPEPQFETDADSEPEPEPDSEPDSEPAPTHETAPAATVVPDPRTPAPAWGPEEAPTRPEPVAATPPGGVALSGRTDAEDLLAILRSPQAHAIRTTPRIRLLGPVDVLGASGPAEPAALPALTEAAAFLALYPGADPAAVERALHPGDHARPDQAGPGVLADLASWLGGEPDGRAFLRQDELDSYALAPTVTCDWDEFRSLYRRGMRSTSATADAALAHALALVRGAPFAETPPTAYGWAEAVHQDMLAAIVDTAHELAARRLQYGDHRSAEAAVFRGLAVAPDVELLHRDLFYAYASAGARDQLLKAVNRLDALSRRTGRNLDPDTVALLRDLLAGG